MEFLPSQSVVVLLLSVGVLLGAARLLGELAQSIRQPAVLGELLAGVVLGPSVLGFWARSLQQALFPPSGPVTTALNGFSNVALVLYLLVAGTEVDLSAVWRQGRTVALVALCGLAVPFALGATLALQAGRFLGADAARDPLVFVLFFATALSISALPVIVRTLKDLGVLRSDLGVVVVPAAIAQDLLGWILFAVVVGLMGAGGGHDGAGRTLLGAIAFAAAMLTAGRWLLHRLLPWIQAFGSWPGGVLGFTASAGLLCAALTEWIGVHAVFGSFLFGVAIGDSRHLRRATRATLEQFVSFVFAPLFFAGIGLRTDFSAHLDLGLVAVVTLVASIGKLLGGGLGARLAGHGARQALAVGVALNSRGAMEVILGLLALKLGIIGEPLFVALVAMALITSGVAPPLLHAILRIRQPRRVADHLSPRAFLRELPARSSSEAIRLLSRALADAHQLDAATVEGAVLERESLMSTELEGGVAVPHAGLAGLAAPLVAVGLSREGIDFDSLDGRPARIVVLILTAAGDEQTQVELLADAANTLRHESARAEVLAARTATELKAALSVSGRESPFEFPRARHAA